VKALVIVQPGEKLPTLESVAGDFADWVLEGLARPDMPVSIVRPHRGEDLPAESGVSAVVVTGSSAMVTERADWMENMAAWLRHLVAHKVPILKAYTEYYRPALAEQGVQADMLLAMVRETPSANRILSNFAQLL
jgi:hypothetical protein